VSHLSIPEQILAEAISTFTPLPHRLETVDTVGGITYVNDSISTVPEAAINALETFGPLVHTIILGGFDRGVSFTGLADYLMHTNVRVILLLPPSGARIAQTLKEHPLFDATQRTLIEVKSMEDAVRHASQCTAHSSVCLLSPASPSFPLFRNFEERGAAFRNSVLQLKA
jgi:UDP-N-acetylmuramoylalanine--D-glutamate ligase